MKQKYSRFIELTKEINRLDGIMGLLSWDNMAMMPPKAVALHGEKVSALAGVIHRLVKSDELSNLLDELSSEDFDDYSKGNLREMKRRIDYAKKIPDSLIKELLELENKAYHVWVDARKKSNFSIFAPFLKDIVKLKRQQAQCLSYVDSPYDALLDLNEHGATLSWINSMFSELKEKQVELLKKISNSKVRIDDSKIIGKYPVETQRNFCRRISKLLGFDFEAGRLDDTVHPFCTALTPMDVRLTNRYDESDFTSAMYSVIHETGHGLYEQGYDPKHFFTPIASAVSFGVHESQSRLMENMIGRSFAFLKYVYPIIQETYKNLSSMPLDEFYMIINSVLPGFIRVDADEVTYNLHIILRTELESSMLDGKIDIDDLPKLWNKKMKDYFDLDVPDDSKGVLQDVHWSSGYYAYFPTYTLGNIYAAQFFSKMKKDIPDLNDQVESGSFGGVVEWLRNNIHSKGSLWTPRDLIKNVTGKSLDTADYLCYLNNKYGEIYKL